nr:uncharacterized protein LOC117219964 [Megalopta genalis]
MLLDPPGFTGPPTSSRRRRNRSTEPRSSSSSSCPVVREERSISRSSSRVRSRPPETGNATAFNVSFDSVSLSVARNVANATGTDERRRSGSRRLRNTRDHRWSVNRREGGDTEDSDVRFSSTSRRSGSRSSRRGSSGGSCKTPTTRLVDRREKDRGEATSGTAGEEDEEEEEEEEDEDRESSKSTVADVTSVPSVDASFAYTAYNNAKNEAGSGRDVQAPCREIELARDQDSDRDRDQEEEEDFRERSKNGRAVRDAKRGESSDKVVWLDRENERFPRGPRAHFRRGSCVQPENGCCGTTDYTARFQEPTTNERRPKDEELATSGPTKVSGSRGRSYGLLFVLYLLAWPLACSTNPSGQFASRFARNPSLGPADEMPRHNVTQISSLLSSSSVVYQPTRQQHLERERYVQDAVYSENEKKKSSGETVGSVVGSVVGHRRHGRREIQVQQTRSSSSSSSNSNSGGNSGSSSSGSSSNDQQREATEIEDSYQSHQPDPKLHPYNEYSWEVNQINPWLSACDLAGPAPADLQGSCGPPEVPKNCPVPCSSNGTNGRAKVNGVDAVFHQVIEKVEVAERQSWSAAGGPGASSGGGGGAGGAGGAGGNVQGRNEGGTDGQERPEGVRNTAPEQCLFYLEESHKKDVCRDDFGRSSTRSFSTPRENRYWFVSGLRLRHCCEHAVVNALAPGKGGPFENVLNGGSKCADALDKLLLVDKLAARLHCEFEEVLARYDCAQPYSVIFNCTHCKEAYRKWVCSSLVPYFAHGGPQDSDTLGTSRTGSRLRPCRSFCQSVEQRCPYLLPGDRAPAYPTQYAGEPTFLCRDPNIEETGEQAARALHNSGEDECCFRVCSEEKPGSGICANCTNREPRKRGRVHDPPTAPYCEINPIQPASTGENQPVSTESSVDGVEEESSSPRSVMQQPPQPQPGTSLCGSGGVGSIPSVSSSDRPSASMMPQAVWLCSLASMLFSLSTCSLLWVPRAVLQVFKPLFTVHSGGAGRSPLGGSGEKTSRLGADLVAWLHGSSAGRVSCVSARHGAKWMLEKWVMVERRCRGGWWFGWWRWWRWRRWRRWRRATKGEDRPRVSGGCASRPGGPGEPGRPGDASARLHSHRGVRQPRILVRGCSSPRVRLWTRDFGRFAAQCRCRWWWWWWRWRWWWLYRWWKSRWKPRWKSRWKPSCRGEKRPPAGRNRGSKRIGSQDRSVDGFRQTPTVRRPPGYRLPSRKDPP